MRFINAHSVNFANFYQFHNLDSERLTEYFGDGAYNSQGHRVIIIVKHMEVTVIIHSCFLTVEKKDRKLCYYCLASKDNQTFRFFPIDKSARSIRSDRKEIQILRIITKEILQVRLWGDWPWLDCVYFIK